MNNEHKLTVISGPSGASKTTTAENIRRELEKAGHRAVVISMDEYFLDVTPWDTPMLRNGQYDFESPLCLDMELLREHFDILSVHGEITVRNGSPREEFEHVVYDDNQRRHSPESVEDVVVRFAVLEYHNKQR